MAAYRPLVRIDGETHVLPDEDRVPVAAIEGAVADDDARLTDAREWTAETVGQAEAEAGTASTRRAWTAQRVRQAVLAVTGAVGTTVGRALFALTNPSAVRFLRINADNTVSARSASEMRTDLGLGTAATATLTASADDTTTGRVLKVGDFNIGAEAALETGVDLNTKVTPGHYFISSSGQTNGPISSYGVLEVSLLAIEGITRVLQKFYAYSTSQTGRVFVRTRGATTWEPWQEQYSSNANSIVPVENGGTNADNAAGARTNLGLGTAATANLTTSIRSTTPGEIMKVGDYGFGAVPAVINGPDWNTIVEPGFHRINASGGSNGPLNDLPINYLLWVLGNDASETVVQVAFSIGTYNYMFYRTKFYPSGFWSSWHQIVFDGHLQTLQNQINTKVTRVSAPTSASSSGTAGSVAYDADYFYVCTATNTWRRVALSSW